MSMNVVNGTVLKDLMAQKQPCPSYLRDPGPQILYEGHFDYFSGHNFLAAFRWVTFATPDRSSYLKATLTTLTIPAATSLWPPSAGDLSPPFLHEGHLDHFSGHTSS
jgi:hypothetical protein